MTKTKASNEATSTKSEANSQANSDLNSKIETSAGASSKKKLYLVDVSSMFFRAFYAIRPLTTATGLPVNAIYGFLSMTVKLMREIRPDYMAFCFDRSEPSFRKDLDVRYKANRSDMPEDLGPQIPYIRTLSEAMGIACLDKLGLEADDIIGTLTHLGTNHGLEVVIVSGDKDFAQLVTPDVSMYDTMKDLRIDEAHVREKWGIDPRKMIDYLAIVGDSSDNVKGVAGLGPKGAEKLLADFDSLEDIYANLDKISSKSTLKKLEEGREEAFLAKKLVTIVCDAELGVQPEDLRLKPIERDKLRELLALFEFKNFTKTLLGADQPADQPADHPVVEATAATVAPTVILAGSIGEETPFTSDSKRSFEKNGSVAGSMAHVLNPHGNEKTISTAFGGASTSSVQPKREVATGEFHEVSGIQETRLDLGGLSEWLESGKETWALRTEHGSYVAQMKSGHWAIAEIAAVGESLGDLLTAKKLKFKGFDIKLFCKEHSVRKPEVVWDQMLAAYVVRAGSIDNIAPLFQRYNGQPLNDLPSPSQLLSAHLNLESNLRAKLKQMEAERVLFEIEQPLVPILLAMENNGIAIDPQMLAIESQALGRDIRELETAIHAGVGEVFNIGSPKQMGHILFEKLKMPTGKKTKTGFSTDTDVLEKLSADFPVTALILQWRELTKLRSTYVDSLPQLINPATGRVHTTFNQATTTTGRLSSVSPNLQNIPIRTERGNMIRKAFVAPAGHQLVSADYSQIELRILAHITEDPGLIRAFEAGIDIHTATASEVFEIKVEDVTPEMRRKAKAVNFGLAYGQGAFGLAENLKIPRKDATAIIARYFQRFARVQEFMTSTIEEAKRKGYVQTVFGRRRYLDELQSSSGMVRKFGERAAINAPIQGTASDVVKLAMISVGEPAHSKTLLQVHDELILEVEDRFANQVAKDVAEKMQSVGEKAGMRVPLQVNTGVGPNWDEAHS